MIKAFVALVVVILIAVVVTVTLIVLDARDGETDTPRERPSIGRTAP